MPKNQELCLLSLDGGGVRGLSTLLILKRIMEGINPETPPKPCEIFHMIGGTSTGGLIALMLGRMRLSIDDCISAYNEMSRSIFTKLHHRINLTNGETQGRFDHKALEKGVKSVLEKYGFGPDERLKDSLTAGSCKTFVCATSQQTGKPVVLSSYYNERRGNDMLNITKIWEAARATSAATTFFDPITIGDESFVDGATGANNPIQYLWSEAGDVWANRKGSLEDEIKCVVSIGTGVPHLAPFGSRLKQVAGALKAISTDTVVTANLFQTHHGKLYDSNRAFRFNVEHGLENVGLEEVDKWGEIKAATRNYIQLEAVHVNIKACAANLQDQEWLRIIRQKLLDLVRPAVSGLNDAESHSSEEDLQWLTHTRAYEKWKRSDSHLLWYRSSDKLTDDSSRLQCVAAALGYHSSKRFVSFAGPHLGVGNKLARALYFQCDRHQGYDDFDIDSAKNFSPADILWSLICQCLLMDCESIPSLNQRILDLEEHCQTALRDALISGQKSQPVSFLFNILFNAIQPIESRLLLTIDNIHLIQESTVGGFIDALFVFIEKRLPQVGLKLPTFLTCRSSSILEEQLSIVESVDDETERNECIESLYFPEWNARRDQVADAEKGTNDWILSNEQYQNWKDAKRGVLWIEGKPGSGKSVLAKSLLRQLGPPLQGTGTDLSTSSDPRANRMTVVRSKIPNSPIVADWFYSTRMGRVGMAHMSLLTSVLYQLLEQDKSLFNLIAPTYRKKPIVIGGKHDQWREREINEALEMIGETGTNIICLIDAMDEASDLADGSMAQGHGRSRAQTILKILWSLVSRRKNSRIKFVALSRPDPFIEMDFNQIRKTYPDTYKIVLERENQGDIKLLIDKGLKNLRAAIRTYDSDSDSDSDGIQTRGAMKYKGLDSARNALSESENEALENIQAYLEKHAEGVVLWVTLILRELEDLAYNGLLTITQLEEHLERLPHKLDALYEHIIKSIQSRSPKSDTQQARSTLILVAGSASLGRPLTVRELWEALAIPDGLEDALSLKKKDPIIANRIRINSWSGFRRQLRRRCGPLIEIVRPYDLGEGGNGGDIGPDDIVQFMHRTVLDFLLDTKRNGLFQFHEEEAQEQVMLTARRYMWLAFPENELAHTPHISLWTSENWSKSISEYVDYLEGKILLRFSLFVLSKRTANRSLDLGYLSRADQSLMGPNTKFPTTIRRLYPQLDTKNQSNSSSSQSSAIAVGEFFRYACSNGLVVATQSLLEIYKASITSDTDYVASAGNGALLAAIQHDLLSEVRTLTKAYGYQARLLKTEQGWPIGRNAARRHLDPFIQIAARSGSIQVLEYLFVHTDRFYARSSAVRKFAITQGDDINEIFDLDTQSDGARSDESSVASFDLVRLGLVDAAEDNGESLVTTLQSDQRQKPDVIALNTTFDEDRRSLDSWDDSPTIVRRNRKREKRREQREFLKLRNTCFEFARSKQDPTSIGKHTLRPDIEDVKDSLRIIVETIIIPVLSMNPTDNKGSYASSLDQDTIDVYDSSSSIDAHEEYLQADAFGRFVDRYVMTPTSKSANEQTSDPTRSDRGPITKTAVFPERQIQLPKLELPIKEVSENDSPSILKVTSPSGDREATVQEGTLQKQQSSSTAESSLRQVLKADSPNLVSPSGSSQRAPSSVSQDSRPSLSRNGKPKTGMGGFMKKLLRGKKRDE